MALPVNALRYKASFDALEVILQDVTRTPAGWCPVCAFTLLHYLRDGSPTLRALQREHHGFWDACIRQIVAEALPADVEAELCAQLRRNIDTCPRARTDHKKTLRTWEKDYITDPLMLFRALICLLLTKCLYGSDTTSDDESRVFSRARDPRKRFRSSDDLWPRHPDQFFPHGPPQTVCALCLACISWNDDGPWYILNAIVQIARPRVIAGLTEVELYASRLGATCIKIIFHGTPYAIEALDESPSGEREILKLPDTPWLRSGAGRRLVAEFLRTLWDGPYARPDEMYHFLSHGMDEFRAVYTAAVERATATGAAEWTSLTLSLHAAGPHVQQARRLVSEAQVILRIEENPRARSVLMAVRLACRSLQADKRCSAPECTRTMLDEDTDRPPLPTCAKCKVARYCSTGCQRTDWRGGTRIAHKRICATLAALQTIAGSISSRDEYAEAVRATGVSDGDLALVGRWAASQSQHYMDLIRTEMVFPNAFSDASPDSESE